MPSDVYNGKAHGRKAPPDRSLPNPPPPIIGRVDASASATDPRAATASRRKVVGVDCVECFSPFKGSLAPQGARGGCRASRHHCPRDEGRHEEGGGEEIGRRGRGGQGADSQG